MNPIAINPVVITGPFTREMQDARWPQQLSRRLGAPVEIHYVYCRPEIRRQRLLLRSDARDQAKLDNWGNYLDYYGSEAPPAAAHVFVDTSNEHADR